MAAKKIRKPKKTAPEKGSLDFCRAIVDADGNLRWEYQFNGLPEADLSHDNDIVCFSDSEIVELTLKTLGIENTDQNKIEVIHE